MFGAKILDPVCSSISQFIRERSSYGGFWRGIADDFDRWHQNCHMVYTGEEGTRKAFHLLFRVGGPLFFMWAWFRQSNTYLNDLWMKHAFSAPLPLSFKVAATGIAVDSAIVVLSYFMRQDYMSLSETFGKFVLGEERL